MEGIPFVGAKDGTVIGVLVTRKPPRGILRPPRLLRSGEDWLHILPRRAMLAWRNKAWRKGWPRFLRSHSLRLCLRTSICSSLAPRTSLNRGGPTETAAAAGAAVGAVVAAYSGVGASVLGAHFFGSTFCFFDGERGRPDFSVATRPIPAFAVATTTGLSTSEAMCASLCSVVSSPRLSSCSTSSQKSAALFASNGWPRSGVGARLTTLPPAAKPRRQRAQPTMWAKARPLNS